MFDLEKIRNLADIAFVDFHSQLDSTSDRAIELVKQNLRSFPALVLTETQTAGRGQRDSRWWSGKGSLTFSWIISYANWSTQNEISQSLIPATVGLAVAEAIEQSTELSHIKLKWPNDLIVVNRKISGILIETVSSDAEKVIVVGIGINVNNANISSQFVDSSGHRPATTPTSILIETGKTTSLDDLLIAILQQLQTRFQSLKSQPAAIVDRCNQRLVHREKEIRVTLPNGKDKSGICMGISSDGGLILNTINGIETIFSGTIQAV